MTLMGWRQGFRYPAIICVVLKIRGFKEEPSNIEPTPLYTIPQFLLSWIGSWLHPSPKNCQVLDLQTVAYTSVSFGLVGHCTVLSY